MGGIQLSPSESLVLGIHFLLTFLCVITLPVWLVGGVVSAFGAAKGEKFIGYGSDRVALANGGKVEAPQATEVSTTSNEVNRSVWWFVGAQLALGVVLASAMLPVQARQWHLQRVLKQKDFAAAAEMSHQIDRDRFPPHLDLPPQISYGDPVVQLYRTVNGLTQFGAADWLMDYYFEELLKDSIGKRYKHSAVESYDLIDNQGLVQYLQVVRTAKDPQLLIEPQLESLRWLIYIEEDSERKELLEKLVEAGGFEREDIVEAH